MEKWRFVAIDVDGTLLDDNDHYDVPRFNRVIRQLAAQGIHFIVAIIKRATLAVKQW